MKFGLHFCFPSVFTREKTIPVQSYYSAVKKCPGTLEALVMRKHLFSGPPQAPKTKWSSEPSVTSRPARCFSTTSPERRLQAHFAPCQTWSKASNHLFLAFLSTHLRSCGYCKLGELRHSIAKPDEARKIQLILRGTHRRRNRNWTRARVLSRDWSHSSAGAHVQFGARRHQAMALLVWRQIMVIVTEPQSHQHKTSHANGHAKRTVQHSDCTVSAN